jgi:PAS domain S-box-containing protein
MHLYTAGIISYYAPPEVLIKSKIIWIADFNLTILTALITGYALYETFKAYQQIVKMQHDTQEEFNYTLDKLPIPVAVLMEDQRIPYFNENFYNYFGYESEEIATFEQWLEKVYPDVNDRTTVAAVVKKQMEYAFKEQKQLPLEYFDFKTKTGELKSAEVHHTFHGDRAVCAFVDITERRKKRRLVIETMMQAEEKENKRIAQELHDGVGPLLSTAKIYAHALVSNCHGEEAKGFGEKLNELLNNAIKELRNTINNVSPQILQRYGLIKALESFVEHIQPIKAIRFNIVAIQLNTQSPLVELAIYRSLVELINNSIKYGSPSNIQVKLETTGSSLVVEYMDDGKGFKLEEKRLKGFGISNIINRIDSIGGFCNITTSPGEGVMVKITFDIKVVNNDTDSNC